MTTQIERWPGELSGVPLATAVARWNDKASWPRLALRDIQRVGSITEHAVLRAEDVDGDLALKLADLGTMRWRSIASSVVGSTRVPSGRDTGKYDGAVYIATPEGRLAVDLVRGDREVIASWLLRALVSATQNALPFRDQVGLEYTLATLRAPYRVRSLDVAPEVAA
jgi:hypothetical protein